MKQSEQGNPTGPRPHVKPARLPDPDKKNKDRASWAESAILAFENETGSDREDSICDLLADLAHFCDRHGFDMTIELSRAATHYDAETNGRGKQLREIDAARNLRD